MKFLLLSWGKWPFLSNWSFSQSRFSFLVLIRLSLTLIVLHSISFARGAIPNSHFMYSMWGFGSPPPPFFLLNFLLECDYSDWDYGRMLPKLEGGWGLPLSVNGTEMGETGGGCWSWEFRYGILFVCLLNDYNSHFYPSWIFRIDPNRT